jgi:RNA polymerase sigma-70 factor (ECF subfamily)
MEFEENIKPIGKRYFVCVWVMIMTLQDLAQETFIILAKLETFRNESSIGTWIFHSIE